MNWGQLWEYPFQVSVWGTASTVIGTLVTSVSVALAAGYYIADRRRDARSQASQLQLVQIGSNPNLTLVLRNLSANSVYDLSSKTTQISFFETFTRRDFYMYDVTFYLDDFEKPSDQLMFDYWKSAPYFQSSAQLRGDFGVLKSQDSREFRFDHYQHGAMRYWVEFTDAQGQRWKLIYGKRKPVKTSPHNFFSFREPSLREKIIAAPGHVSNYWAAIRFIQKRRKKRRKDKD